MFCWIIWDNHSYGIRNHISVKRWSSEPIDKEKFKVEYPAQNDWMMGNQQVVRSLESVLFIDTESKVCPNKKCDRSRMFRMSLPEVNCCYCF